MAVYDYACHACGPFTLVRPMAEHALPGTCPACGASASRAFLTAPAMSTMAAGRRAAFATNERSAHAPRSSREAGHGPGCGCCRGKATSRPSPTRPDGAKSFPAARPWMISH